MASAEYTDAKSALSTAKKNIQSIGLNLKWTTEQIGVASKLADDAYADVTGYFDTYLNMIQTQSSWIFGGEDSDMVAAKDFWEALYSTAKIELASFPDSDRLLEYLASAAKTAHTVSAGAAEGNAVVIVTGGVAGTLEDLGDAGKEIANIATDKTTWYVVGAVAALGALLYIRAVTRSIFV